MLQERQVTSYLILRKNNLSMYLKNFDIAHDIFNYDITYSDVNLLKTYYEEKKKYADVLTVEDEFTGNTYNNLDVINNNIKKLKKINIRNANQ